MTKVSVIVPCYNHEAFIAEALASVLNQTAPIDEVIVVDDASTDRSLEIIRSNRDPLIRLIALKKNQRGKKRSISELRKRETSSSPFVIPTTFGSGRRLSDN